MPYFCHDHHDHPIYAGWLEGGFPAMQGNVAFLMKDLVRFLHQVMVCAEADR